MTPTATDERRTGSSPFFVSALDGSPRWVSGALAAAQGGLLSILTIVLPSVAAYVVTSADPSNADVPWLRSVGVGSSLWLAGHGVPIAAGGAQVDLVPLGITALALFTCYASARRSGVPTRDAYGAGVGAYAVLTVLVALLVGQGTAGLVRAALGGAVVAAVGLGTGLLVRPDAPSFAQALRPAAARLAPPVQSGLAAAAVAVAGAVLVGAVTVAAWVLAGRAEIVEIAAALELDWVGGATLALGQLAFLPNLVVWAVAWLSGAGFAVGAGTHLAPGESVVGALPALPITGALPAVAGGPLRLAPLALVAVGAVAGWYLHRRTRRLRERAWWHGIAACGVLAVAVAVAVGVLVAAASGGAGPGRMAQVGAQPWLVGLLVGTEAALGALLVAVPADARIRAGVRRRVGR